MSEFVARTKDLMVGDVLSTGDSTFYEVVTVPEPGGPNGRWIFTAREVDSTEVQTHHAQPDFEWRLA